MNTLRSNIVSNFASKAVLALGMLVFTPIYLKILGIEAVGLVGLWMTVRSFLTLLDFGMSTTLNREIAAARANGSHVGQLWNSLRTLEAISWSIALSAGLLFMVIAPWTGSHWLNLTTTSPGVVAAALVFLGWAAAFQLPTILYQGGLTGLERQVSMNRVIIACSLVRDIGAILILRVFPPTIVTFFLWQAFVSGVQCLAQGVLLRRALPAAQEKARVDFGLLRSFGKFTAGTGLISVTVMFLGLADRVVLTKVVPLAMFGVYSLVQTAAGAILILVSPMTTAAFPRFVNLFVNDRIDALTDLYHEFSQLIAIAVFPVASTLIAFSGPVLFAWTGKLDIAEHGRATLALVALATGLNALLYLPLQAQLASQWTKLTLIANAVSVIMYVPLMVVLASRFGIVGAGISLVCLMAGQLLIIPAVMHRRLLKGAGVDWYLRDLLLPALPSVIFGTLAGPTLRFPASRVGTLGVLFTYWLLLVVLTAACSPLALRRIRSLAVRRGYAV